MRPFYILDVFTDEAYAGNPLAVVLDARGLDDRQCQTIAREFNQSETVFVSEPRDPINTAAIRIFTPTRELPFAGHPTVGTAALLALLRAPEMLARQDLAVVIEQAIGPVECIVRRAKKKLRASFTLPILPERSDICPAVSDLAVALSLAPEVIGFDRHTPAIWSAGVPFVMVPVASRAAVAAARPDPSRWSDILQPPAPSATFVYTRDVATEGSSFHARMFAPAFGMTEDPATGSAVAAFAGLLCSAETFPDGDHTLVIEQGFEMGRPSFITLGLDVSEGRLVAASIGGGAVLVAQGTLA